MTDRWLANTIFLMIGIFIIKLIQFIVSAFRFPIMVFASCCIGAAVTSLSGKPVFSVSGLND